MNRCTDVDQCIITPRIGYMASFMTKLRAQGHLEPALSDAAIYRPKNVGGNVHKTLRTILIPLLG